MLRADVTNLGRVTYSVRVRQTGSYHVGIANSLHFVDVILIEDLVEHAANMIIIHTSTEHDLNQERE